MDAAPTPPPAEPMKPDTTDVPPAAGTEPAAKEAPVHAAIVMPRTHNTAIVAIVMAVVIALGLGGIGAMAYLNTQNNVKPAPQSTTATAPTPKVSSNDVSKATDDMSTALKSIDDAQDFGPNDLSDTTLGIQ